LGTTSRGDTGEAGDTAEHGSVCDTGRDEGGGDGVRGKVVVASEGSNIDSLQPLEGIAFAKKFCWSFLGFNVAVDLSA
jgi:hypothetical protein